MASVSVVPASRGVNLNRRNSTKSPSAGTNHDDVDLLMGMLALSEPSSAQDGEDRYQEYQAKRNKDVLIRAASDDIKDPSNDSLNSLS